MTASVEKLQKWLEAKEDEHLECKEAKNNFHFETLVKYCVALANEGGGKMILGVTDQPPRTVVGSQAFQDLERTKAGLIERLRLRVDVEELRHPDDRVLVFQVPSRPIGVPIHYEGAYWMRGGQDLIPMTPDLLQRIFAEAGLDFSAEVCALARLDDLAPTAVDVLRRLWQRKSPDQDIAARPVERLLVDAELVVDGRMTYAALILLGKHEALGRHLAQAEVVFEYRSSEAPGPAADRHEFRQGFLPVLDEIWRLINLRNDLQHFQQGFFVWDVPTFNERAVREAVLNAVSHRDYRHGGSVFVRQYARRIEIVSPGGFPPALLPRTSSGNKIRAIAVSPRSSANADWSNAPDRGLTSSFASAYGRASRCPTSPTHTPTPYGSRCTARSKTRSSCVFSRRSGRNARPHSALTIFW